MEPTKTYKIFECKVVRLRDQPVTAGQAVMDSPDRIYEAWKKIVVTAPWWTPDAEIICVWTLNTRMRITGMFLLGIGTLDTCIMCPREVYRPAIVAAAHSIILTHSHPSGDPTPSESDLRETRRIASAGDVLKIKLLDHIIIGSRPVEGLPPYRSLLELGYLP